MADTLSRTRGGKRILSKILKRLERGSSMTTYAGQNSTSPRAWLRRKKRVWVVGPNTAADPAVDANSHLTYPVKVGELAYREDSDEAFICSVAPTANTAATFIQLHA